jgi:spermidine synthase
MTHATRLANVLSSAAQSVKIWWCSLTAIRRQTMFGTARIYEFSDGGDRVRVLDMGGTFQSATYVDERWYKVPFKYLALLDCMFAAKTHVGDVCMLGGGGYSYPKQFIVEHPQARMDVVEIDPAITQIAREYFFLDRLEWEYEAVTSNRLKIISQDAMAYLQGCAQVGRRYDAIVNDCFVVEQKDASLATPEGIHTVRKSLKPDGLYLANTICALEGDLAEPLMEFVAALSAEFDHVHVLPCDKAPRTEIDNMVVVASNKDHDLPGAIRLYDAVP